MMKRLLVAALALLASPVFAAETIQPGHVLGNGTATEHTPTDTSLATIMGQSGSGMAAGVATALGIVPNASGGMGLINGTMTNGNCLKWTTTTGITDAGGACGGGGGAVASVSNSDGTLTITPTTGAVVASIALGHANTWMATQTLTGPSPQVLLGSNGGNGGKVQLFGATSGSLTIDPQAVAGSPVWAAGTSSGTPAVTASAPLAITVATGNIAITGAAGQVLAGATPGFTATPTLGTSGATAGSIALFGNTSTGTITVNTAYVGSSNFTASIPAITGNDTFGMIGLAQTLSNKTLASPVFSGTASGAGTIPIAVLSGLGSNVATALGLAINASNALPKIDSVVPTVGHCLQWTATGITDAGGSCTTGGGGGTVTSGTAPQLAYYASTGTAVSGLTAGTSGQFLVANVSAVPTWVTASGDCTLVASGALTCTKTNGTSFSALATTTPGTGVATALGVNVGTAGSFVVNGGALGTPSSGTLTNATGLPLAGMASQAANTVVGALTATTPSALAMPSCFAAGSALEWQSGAGFQCNTSITASTVPASGLSGTTLASGVVTSSLTTVGTIGTGTWQGSLIGATYGGTGVNNGSSTLTLGASLTTTGTGAPTLAFPATTSYTYTYPANTGTLAELNFAQTWTATQTFPSPAFTGTVSGAGTIPLTVLATQATNTITGNATAGLASPTALAIGSCSTAASALLWTTNTGFSCNTSITAAAVPVGGISGLGTNVATFLATPTSANLAAALTDETGTGAAVFGTNPAIGGETFSTSATVTAGTNAQGQGALTTDLNAITTTAANPSGVTLPTATVGRRVTITNRGTNPVNIFPATGAAIDALATNASISISVGATLVFNAATTTLWYSDITALAQISGFGAGVATALAVNVGTAGSFVVNGGALGTPSSGTLTNATGLPVGGIASIATNTIVGNATSGSASPTALAIGTCSTAASALLWTTNTGFSCNTSITAAAVPATGVSAGALGSTVTVNNANWSGTGLSVANGGTGQTSALTQFGVIYASATTAMASTAAGTTSTLLQGNAAGAPTWVSTLPATVQGNITTVGTIGTGTWQGSVVGLTYGGTNAALTASNGGIVYSTASAFAVLSGTVTAGQCLLSGSSTAPSWGSCAGGAAVSSVSNSDGTLTISPTTGAVVASIALGHVNTWTGAQTFSSAAPQVTIGASGVAGNIAIFNGTTTNTLTLAPTSAASSTTATFPSNTGTVAELNLAQTWTAAQTHTGTGPQVILGANSGNIGEIQLLGSTSGSLLIVPQAVASTPTWTAGTSSGTPAVTASSPLAITTATGNITCATCATTTNGGALSGTAPVAISAAGAVSITGAAGQVLAGASPAFTATPTLGVISSANGTLSLANSASANLVTIASGNNAGAWTLTLPTNVPGTAGSLLSSTTGGVSSWLATVPVANGGTNCAAASITCFNNITGFTAAGTTGTTSTNLVFSTSPTFVTPVLGAATATSVAIGGSTALTANAAAADVQAGTSGALVVTPTALMASAAPQALTATGFAWNAAIGYNATATLTGNTQTIPNPTNIFNGQTYTIIINPSTFTGYAWGTAFNWGAAGAPTLTASKNNVIACVSTATWTSTPTASALLCTASLGF